MAYYLIRSADGGASVTVCQDPAGTSESSRRAADWIRESLTTVAGEPPEITEGEVVFNF